MISLLYPENYTAGERRLGKTTADDLELGYIAMLICPYNTEYALNILTELITDENVIRWRQDVLEDFINVPQLENRLYKSIHTIYEGAVSVYARFGSTQSFFELSENISRIEAFESCMDECHDFIAEYGGKIKSDGIRAVLGEIDRNYTSDEHKKLISEIKELKTALEHGFKSVTFGINFDELMRPCDVMLLSVGKEPIKKKTMFERLLKRDDSAEPMSDIYARKYREGQTVRVDNRLFEELDRLGGDYVRRVNSAISRCYKSCTDLFVKLAPQIDFYIGAKGLFERAATAGLPVCCPKIVPKERRIFICRDIYDPVLACKTANISACGEETRPIMTNCCDMDADARIFIITGTNNGGKTTYIRAAAANQILAQAGLCVCASEAMISPCSSVFSHYPTKEKVGIDMSRFTEECRSLRETVVSADKYSLVLLNESLSSTNPYDSMIVAEELLKILADIGCRALYTTHIPDMTEIPERINKLRPNSRLRALIAMCDESGAPTYEITSGKPDLSRNARYIYERFGISYESYLKAKTAHEL